MAGYDTERLISFTHIVDTFGFADEGESDEDAIARARRFYQESIDRETENLAQDGREEFWRPYIEENTAKRDNLRIETWEQYKARQRASFLTKPKETTEARWWKQLEVLPPAGLLMCDHFTEFYISEAYTGTWHSGYLHDRKTGKYWTSMVDAADKTTRLCVRLGIVKEG